MMSSLLIFNVCYHFKDIEITKIHIISSYALISLAEANKYTEGNEYTSLDFFMICDLCTNLNKICNISFFFNLLLFFYL